MTWHRHAGRPRPPWWPENEEWPPVGGRHAWQLRRGRFVRLAAVVVAAMLFLSLVGMASLMSIVTRGRSGATTIPILVAVGSLVLLMGLLVAVVRRVGVPIGHVVEASDRLAAGDFSTRVAVHGSRPIRIVGSAFNSMAARLEAQSTQRRELMADIAHELRTPLTVLQGRLEGLLDGVYPRDDLHLNEVLEETRLLSRLVEDLRTLANAESGMLRLQKEPTDVASLCQEIIGSLSADARRHQVAIELDAPTNVRPITVDPLRIREVLVNVVSNALHYTPPFGEVSLTIRQSHERVSIAVHDTGPGITAEDLPRIFDRFYKGRTSRGSGLGLTISRNLVVAHGGEIHAESSPAGATLTITLPDGDTSG